MTHVKDAKISPKCEMCEIVLDIPTSFRIFQYAPLRLHKFLVILTNERETISYITAYNEAKKYIFRRKCDNSILLANTTETYGC